MQGLDPSVGYITPVGSAAGEGVVFRNKLSPYELVKAPVDGDYHNTYHLFSRGGLRLRPTAPCLGSRVRDDGSVSTYQWQTYQEVSARVDAFAAALWRLELVPMTADGKRFLGFFLKNCRDWMVGALACYRTGVVVVPMYDTLGPETVGYIQRQTTMATALCTATELALLTKQPAIPFASVLVSGPLGADARAAAEAKGVRVLTVAELETVRVCRRRELGGRARTARSEGLGLPSNDALGRPSSHGPLGWRHSDGPSDGPSMAPLDGPSDGPSDGPQIALEEPELLHGHGCASHPRECARSALGAA